MLVLNGLGILKHQTSDGVLQDMSPQPFQQRPALG